MTSEHKLNVAEMFQVGCDFYDCAYMCKMSCINPKWDAKVLAVPEAVNFAFSCEVFLKTLLCLNSISYRRGHKLEELFNALPERYKTNIIQQCTKTYEDSEETFDMGFLSNVSDSFEKWRYCYEQDNQPLKIGFLYVFAGILKELCENEILYKSLGIGETNE